MARVLSLECVLLPGKQSGRLPPFLVSKRRRTVLLHLAVPRIAPAGATTSDGANSHDCRRPDVQVRGHSDERNGAGQILAGLMSGCTGNRAASGFYSSPTDPGQMECLRHRQRLLVTGSASRHCCWSPPSDRIPAVLARCYWPYWLGAVLRVDRHQGGRGVRRCGERRSSIQTDNLLGKN